MSQPYIHFANAKPLHVLTFPTSRAALIVRDDTEACEITLTFDDLADVAAWLRDALGRVEVARINDAARSAAYRPALVAQ